MQNNIITVIIEILIPGFIKNMFKCKNLTKKNKFINFKYGDINFIYKNEESYNNDWLIVKYTQICFLNLSIFFKKPVGF